MDGGPLSVVWIGPDPGIPSYLMTMLNRHLVVFHHLRLKLDLQMYLLVREIARLR
jgi:hypothetical protein